MTDRDNAIVEGSGTIYSDGGYAFMLRVGDTNPDTFRIWSGRGIPARIPTP